MVHDMIEVEKMGKPGVPIVSGRFEGDAIASSRAFGMPELQFVIVPRIYRNLPLDECVSQTELAFEEIVSTLTSNGETSTVDQRGADEGNRNFEGDDRYDAVLRMNEEFIGRDWGDGFPLNPATREAVDELLTGTCLAPEDEVCDVPPGFGIATVEKIAINAALAGARPEHMPVIIASVKALSEIGGQGGKSLLMSTSPQAPLLIVNGPIAREIGLNPRSALGPGPRQPYQHRRRPCVFAVPAEHRVLVPERDGHGHHWHDAQVRALHRRKRVRQPVGALPRRPADSTRTKARSACSSPTANWTSRTRATRRQRDCSRTSPTA